MKKFYITGCIVSAVLHAPLLKHKEYGAYGISVFLWPAAATVWGMYLQYLTWGTYNHAKMVREKLGCYAEEN